MRLRAVEGMRRGSGMPDKIENGVAVVSAIGNHVRSGRHLKEEVGDGAPVVGLAAVKARRTVRPFSPATAWILVVSPPRERLMA